MNLLNLIESANIGYDNLRALMQAVQNSQDAVLTIGGEPITLTYPEARFIFGKYKAYNKAGRQEEFIADLGNPVKFDLHMKQLRQLLDKQKAFRGSVPGERGVAGDVPQGVAEEQQVEEIALQDPNNMTPGTYGKLNWENMIKAYMDNRPYAEFEFGKGSSPLTIYRTQIYAILKDFGSMKPQQKINIILNTFGDKFATVEYIDKLRQKGRIPKTAPAYKRPDAEPVSPQQMTLPGMSAPKIREAEDQKKNSSPTELGRDNARSPKVQRAFQLARARQAAAGSDIEAFVKDELEKSEQAQAELEQLRSENERQDQQIQQLAAKVRQQDQEINQVAEPGVSEPAKAEPKAKGAEPKKREEPKAKREPEKREEPKDQDVKRSEPRAEPAPAEKPQAQKPPKKPSKPSKPQKPPKSDVPDNVIQGPWGQTGTSSVPQDDDIAAAMSGIDLPMTGTYSGQSMRMQESKQELNIGDPVIIRGNVNFSGKTGDVVDFGRDKNFVVVDLYNFGKHAFHASNVEYNSYADQEDYLDEDQVDEMQTKLDRITVGQPPAGGTDKQRKQFLDARDRLYRQMQHASTADKEILRLKIAELEGQAQAKGIRIREAGEHNRAGHNAINSVHDWAEKIRVMRELQKDIALMADPEAKAAVQQRIGDLLKVGMQQGYIKEALSDKAMAVLRGLKSQPQATQPTTLDPAKQAEVDAWARDVERNLAPKLKSQQPATSAVDLNTPTSQSLQDTLPNDLPTLRRRIEQLDQLIKMKEMIDKLFLKAQNVRGGIYPGLQADIEAEELYPVPTTDQQYQELAAKYSKDLEALKKFLAMKKAVYREDQDSIGESTALVRLQQAREKLAQQNVAEGLADDFMKMAQDMGMKPRLRGTPDEERARTAAMLKQRAADRAAAPEPAGPDAEERARLEAKLKELEARFDPDFEYSDDHSFWTKQNELRKQIGSIKQRLAQGVEEGICSECGGPSFSDLILAEKQDACYHKVKSRYKVWPSAYASGALVQCRKKGAANWGNKSEGVAEGLNEFSPAGSGGGMPPRGPKTPGRGPWDDGDEDSYGRPDPQYYRRSIDFFGRFEADHFDQEDFDERTGVFKGYWFDREAEDGKIQIAYFKFDDPQRAKQDFDNSPGMGWYYEPQ